MHARASVIAPSWGSEASLSRVGEQWNRVVGPSGSEGVRICLLLGTNGEIKYCQLVSFPRPLGSLQLSTGQKFWKLPGERIYRTAGQWGECPRPTGRWTRGWAWGSRSHTEAWWVAGLTVRLAIMALGSSVQREKEKIFRRDDSNHEEKSFSLQDSILYFLFPLRKAINLVVCFK